MAFFFHRGLFLLNNKTIGITDANYKMALVTTVMTAAASQDLDAIGTGASGVTELSATGYTTGGQAVTFSLTDQDSTDKVDIGLTVVSVVGVTGGSPVLGAIFYWADGSHTWSGGTAYPLAYFGSGDGTGWGFTFNGGTVTFTWSSNLFGDIKTA